MPPPPAHPTSTSGVTSLAITPELENTTTPSNARALLHHLEHLRDSLSDRVDQLSGAVERLRTQASELEAAVTSGSSLDPGFGRRPGTSGIDPLPSFDNSHTPVRRLAPRVTRTTTTTISSTHDPIAVLTRSMDSLGMGMRETRILQADNRGLPPTNLASIASQPKPIIVCSPRAASEPEPEPEPEPEKGPESVVSHPELLPTHTTIGWTEPSPTQSSPAEPAEPAHTPVEAVEDDMPASERWRSIVPPTLHSSESSSRPFRPPPGLTTRGMMVRERQGITVIPGGDSERSDTRGDRDAREAERLDRAIARYQRRHDESQREFHTAWDSERSRAIGGGRVPNEYTPARADALRRHVDNSHRLWHLMHQRSRLPGGVSPTEVPDTPLPIDALRHLVSTSSTFLRRAGGGPLRPRRSRWGLTGTSADRATATPPRASSAEVAAMERSWIERIENERAGAASTPTPDQVEYEYYSDFLYEARQRLRSGRDEADGVPATPRGPTEVVEPYTLGANERSERLARLGALSERLRAADARLGGDGEDRYSARHQEMRDTLARLRNEVARLNATTARHMNSEDEFRAHMATRNNTTMRENRQQLIGYLEESRAQLQEMADHMNRETAGRRELLDRLSSALGRLAPIDAALRTRAVADDMPPQLRDRFMEHVRESAILGPGPTDVRGEDNDIDDVLDRVARARELRERALRQLDLSDSDLRQRSAALESRIHPGRERSASDAETVVPDWEAPVLQLSDLESTDEPDLSRTEQRDPGESAVTRGAAGDRDGWPVAPAAGTVTALLARTREAASVIRATEPGRPATETESMAGESVAAESVSSGGGTANTAPSTAESVVTTESIAGTTTAPSLASDTAGSTSTASTASTEGTESTESEGRTPSASAFLDVIPPQASGSVSRTSRSRQGGAGEASAEQDKETGSLHADAWPAAPSGVPPRPYVSLLDL